MYFCFQIVVKMGLKDTIISTMNELGQKRKPFLFIVDFKGENAIIKPLDNLNNNEISFCFNGVSNTKDTLNISNFNIDCNVFPISFEQYKSQFDKVYQQIERGNTYLLNLTLKTPIKLTASLQDVYYTSKAKYKLYIKDKFVCFSPEIFVQIKNNTILSFPMKGTINANLPNAEQTLLNDSKEIAEHYTIVDLIRNDLNIVAKKVKVDRFRYVDKIESAKGAIFQTSSQISGKLSANWHNHIGDIFSKLLPAGSVTGSPKESTVNIIENTETYHRKYYTGIGGIYDGSSIDSAVLIRFIEKENDNYFYKSGGGITFSSDVKKEYEELLQKIYIPY